MKRKLFLLGLCFLIVAVALTVQTLTPENKVRIIQHRQSAASSQVCEGNRIHGVLYAFANTEVKHAGAGGSRGRSQS